MEINQTTTISFSVIGALQRSSMTKVGTEKKKEMQLMEGYSMLPK